MRLCGKLLNAGLVVAEERYAEVLRVVVGTPSHLQRIAGQQIRLLKDAHHASVPVLQGDLQRQTRLSWTAEAQPAHHIPEEMHWFLFTGVHDLFVLK